MKQALDETLHAYYFMFLLHFNARCLFFCAPALIKFILGGCTRREICCVQESAAAAFCPYQQSTKFLPFRPRSPPDSFCRARDASSKLMHPLALAFKDLPLGFDFSRAQQLFSSEQTLFAKTCYAGTKVSNTVAIRIPAPFSSRR